MTAISWRQPDRFVSCSRFAKIAVSGYSSASQIMTTEIGSLTDIDNQIVSPRSVMAHSLYIQKVFLLILPSNENKNFVIDISTPPNVKREKRPIREIIGRVIFDTD